MPTRTRAAAASEAAAKQRLPAATPLARLAAADAALSARLYHAAGLGQSRSRRRDAAAHTHESYWVAVTERLRGGVTAADPLLAARSVLRALEHAGEGWLWLPLPAAVAPGAS